MGTTTDKLHELGFDVKGDPSLKEAFEGVSGERRFIIGILPDGTDQPATSFDVWNSSNYYEDMVYEALEEAQEIAPIKEACITYSGNEDCYWRIRFDPKKQEWYEESGHVEFADYTIEEIMDVFRKYIEADIRENGREAVLRKMEQSIRPESEFPTELGLNEFAQKEDSAV